MHITVNLNISNSKRGEYSYAISEEQYNEIKIGSQVIVNLNNQLKLGTVTSKQTISNFDFVIKPIVAIYKINPLNNYQAKLARTIFQNSISGMLEVQQLFVPTISDKKIDIEYYDNGQLITTFKQQKNKQQLLAQNYEPKVIVDYKQEIKQYMYVTTNHDKQTELTAKQQIVWDYVKEQDSVSVAKVIAETGVSRAVINTMVKNEILYQKMKSKQFETLFELEWHQTNQLTSEQKFAVESFIPGLNLLYGVSSSGKTEVYIELIKQQFNANQQVLVVVPSVMLAIQVVGRMQSVFDNVLIYHSKLTDGEKLSYRKQISDGQAKVIVATFEGLLLPFKNLGLVVFDEAHSTNYKISKRINVNKQVVIDSLIEQKIDVLLGSATPLVSDYAMTQYDKANLITLPSRYGQGEFPTIEFVKPREEVISSRLEELININHTRNKPTMVFFNKSGYAKQVLCNECYHLHLCPHCNKPLAYSQKRNRLECKYDGYKINYTNRCLRCNSTNLQLIGTGIEQFHNKLKQAFPDLRIALVDSHLSSDELYQAMHDFGTGEIDLLVGTQTIAFGIDFLNVDTVYITNIDNLLTMNEFTSHERTYNLLEQVAGRVGRNSKFSNAIIETNFEQHFVMQAIANHDYYSYYQSEMKLRKDSSSFPFVRSCKIEFSSENKIKLENIAEQFCQQLKGLKQFEVSALQEPYLDFRFNKHRKYVLIKYRHQNIREIIKQNIKILETNNIDYNIDLNNIEIGV